MEIKDLLSLEDPQELSNEERLDGPYHSPKAKAEPIETFDHHKKRDVIPVTGVNDLVDMPIDSLAPLFEHFIVVGASSDVSQESVHETPCFFLNISISLLDRSSSSRGGKIESS